CPASVDQDFALLRPGCHGRSPREGSLAGVRLRDPGEACASARPAQQAPQRELAAIFRNFAPRGQALSFVTIWFQRSDNPLALVPHRNERYAVPTYFYLQ